MSPFEPSRQSHERTLVEREWAAMPRAVRVQLPVWIVWFVLYGLVGGHFGWRGLSIFSDTVETLDSPWLSYTVLNVAAHLVLAVLALQLAATRSDSMRRLAGIVGGVLTGMIAAHVALSLFVFFSTTPDPARDPQGNVPMQIQYLEIVTPELDATCATLAKTHGVTFGEPDAALGNARTASLSNGGMIGVRAPMHESETPIVRPYVLVDDIEAAVQAAVDAGGELAHPPMELPGHGTFAIYIQGGVHHGLWQK